MIAKELAKENAVWLGRIRGVLRLYHPLRVRMRPFPLGRRAAGVFLGKGLFPSEAKEHAALVEAAAHRKFDASKQITEGAAPQAIADIKGRRRVVATM